MEDAPIKLILLQQRSEYLIGKVTELDEEPAILIENCYEVSEEDLLVPFPKYSAQRDVFLTSESIMSILDPAPKLLETYNAL
jgi:hypothetical protein